MAWIGKLSHVVAELDRLLEEFGNIPIAELIKKYEAL